MAGEDAAVELTIPTVVHFEQILRLYYFTSILMYQQTQGHNPNVTAAKLPPLQEHQLLV